MKKIYHFIFKHPAKTVTEMKRRKCIVWIITLVLIALWIIVGAATRSEAFSTIMVPIIILLIVILVMVYKEEKSDFPKDIICPKCHNRMIDSIDKRFPDQYYHVEIYKSGYRTVTKDVEVGHASFTVKGENVNATIYGKQDEKEYYTDYKVYLKCKHCGEAKEKIVSDYFYNEKYNNLFSFESDWSH